MITAIALDDELPALNIIETFCCRVKDIIHLQRTFNKPTEALQYIIMQPVDLLFLDINIPSLSGIDFYKAIPVKSMVIFTTGYTQYAVEGFNLKAVDYLLKPFTYERFRQAVERADERHRFSTLQKETVPETPLIIRAEYSFIKVNPSDILYIESIGDYIKIYVQNRRPIVTRITMKNIVDMLPSEFIRIHRSYVVAINKVMKAGNKTAYVEGKELPVSSTYEEEFMKRYKSNN